jgi:heme-degrading monooxygenase HmoA
VPMIARRWRGRVPADRSDAYLAYLERTGLPDYAATPGHVRTTVLRRTVDGVTEFELITFWESLDAIRAFAGDDVERARYYPEDRDYLLELPERVEHWEVLGD